MTKYFFSFLGNYFAMMENYSSTFSPTFATTERFCYESDDKTHARDPTKGLELTIFIILGLIGLLICLGTLIELATYRKKEKEGVPMQLIKSFSLVSNSASLLATKSGSGHLDSMNGMK